MTKPLGITIYEGASMLNGAPIVAIITLHSSNRKTGDMAQLWILPTLADPVHSVRLGIDDAVCGNCPHRGAACYVDTGKAPLSVYRAWKRGRYLSADTGLEAADFALHGRMLRLGAYGDPAAVPEHILRRLVAACDGHTGYTHQWRRFPTLSDLCMASADSAVEQVQAASQGWRCFRVLPVGTTADKGASAPCPAVAKGKQCTNCRLCNGKRSPTDRRKSIHIEAHGPGAKRIV